MEKKTNQKITQKMGVNMKFLTALFFLFFAQNSWACNFDSDCQIGAKCVIAGYSIDGVCVGDIDTKYRGSKPKDTGYKYDSGYGSSNKGDSCSFDSDCGVGGQCLKDGYSAYGVCNK